MLREVRQRAKERQPFLGLGVGSVLLVVENVSHYVLENDFRVFLVLAHELNEDLFRDAVEDLGTTSSDMLCALV